MFWINKKYNKDSGTDLKMFYFLLVIKKIVIENTVGLAHDVQNYEW